MRAAESRDQYKTRVERSADDSTRIFVAHRGQELIIDENSDALDNTGLKQGWQFVPSDSTKEVEMLSRLMIFLGMQEGQVKQQLVNLGGLSPRASLQKDKDDQPFLMVNSGLQQTLNRVHYKMDKRAIAISDENIQSNEVVLTLDGKALNALEVLKKSGDNISIRLEGSANSNTTRIDVLNAAGSSVHDDEALKLLGFLLEQLR
jgi:outer membrane protein assembly factor BamC